MATHKQLRVNLSGTLKGRIIRDCQAFGRSESTIAMVALREFYNRPIPERQALLLKEQPPKGRSPGSNLGASR